MTWRKLLAIAALAAAVAAGAIFAARTASATTFTKAYDVQIKKSAEQWLPGVPWLLLKAQLFQESQLDPTARSNVGAEGIAQMMPKTWAEVSRSLGYSGIPSTVAGPAIMGAAYYDAQVRKRWNVSDLEKHRFGLGSYNAGAGNIDRAVRACGGSLVWETASRCLLQITGASNAKQTQDYVTRIWHWWNIMVATN